MKAFDRPLEEIVFLTEFRDFCRSKGEERYDYCSNGGCAIAQFIGATGRAQKPYVSWFGLWTDAAVNDDLSDDGGFNKSPDGVHGAVRAKPRTFSALADRLDALIPAAVRQA